MGQGEGHRPARETDDLFDVTADGVVLRVHVQPRAGRDVVTGRHGDALKVRVTAPPADGRANAAVARQLATLFAVAPSSVELVSGPTSRSKRFLLVGVGPADARRCLAPVLEPRPDPGPGSGPHPGAGAARGTTPGTTPGAARLRGDG